MIDNAVHGLGLRWNVAERVQVYTHPLWMLALTLPYAATGETLWTVGLAGVLVTLAALALLTRALMERPLRAFAFLALLATSKSVLSYASSGLENPLSLLLLVLLLARSRRDAPPLGNVLLAALLALSRMDLLLVAAPLVLPSLLRVPRRQAATALLLGGLPFVAWEAFSLVYYGLLVPNTALAKLATGVPRGTLLLQGLRYVASLGLWDPAGAALLVLGLIVGRRSRLALGLVTYCGYIVWIGGDFMCGRFFSVPIVLASFLLCEAPWPRALRYALVAVPLLVFASADVGPLGWLRGRDPFWTRWGIVDERVFYYPHTGLVNAERPRDLMLQPFARIGLFMRLERLVVNPCIGMAGYYAGPTVHIVDPMALADPLLARLPVADPAHFRIGHFERAVPEGYVESLRRERNLVTDRDLARYWDAVWVVTHGPIFTAQRAGAIRDLASGRLDGLRAAYLERNPAPRPAQWTWPPSVPASDLTGGGKSP